MNDFEIPEWNARAYHYDRILCPQEKFTIPEKYILPIAYLTHLLRGVKVHKFSLIISISGGHRSGKSRFASLLGSLFDENFLPNLNERTVTSPEKLLEQYKYLSHNNIYGACTLIDEAGTTISGSLFYERAQKAINFCTQIFGKYKPIIILVAPSRDMISSTMRRLIRVHIEVKRYDNSSNMIQIYECKYSTVRSKGKGEYTFRKPLVKLFGKTYKLGRIKVSNFPEIIEKAYGLIEDERKPQMVDQFVNEIKKGQIGELKEELSKEKISDFVVNNFTIFENKDSKPNKISLDVDLIKEHFQFRSLSRAKVIRQAAESTLNAKLREIEESINTEQTGGKT